MPIRENREYRAMPVMGVAQNEQRIASDYYVEGYAATYEPYLLFDDGNVRYMEQIAPGAFDKADMSDVLFLHNHEGRCLARNRMKAGKEPTLILEVDEHGLFTAADLGTIEEARNEHNAIVSGLVYQMSFAFTVAEDDIVRIDDATVMRTIKSFRKIYDVSSVDQPANPTTGISARSAFDGFIESEKQELLKRAERERQMQRIRIMSER